MKSATSLKIRKPALIFTMVLLLAALVYPFTDAANAQSRALESRDATIASPSQSPPTKLDFLDSGRILIEIYNDLLSDGTDGDRFVFGGTYTLEEGETLDGDLLVIGGIATLETDSLVKGDVVVIGGTLSSAGLVEGDVFTMGGLIHLGEAAEVEGDVSAFGGKLEYNDRAQIHGEVYSGDVGPFQFTFSEDYDLPHLNMQNFRFGFNPFWDILWLFFRSFIWAALAVLVVLLIQQNVQRTARTSVSQPIISAGLGLLTMIVAPAILLLIAITIIGIPIVFLGVIFLAAAWSLGIIAIGYEIGKRMAKMFQAEWAPAVSAGIGAFILTLVANGIGVVVPCIGWMVAAVIGMIGLGGVFLTRLGTLDYPPNQPVGIDANRILPTSDQVTEYEPPNVPPETTDDSTGGASTTPGSSDE